MAQIRGYGRTNSPCYGCQERSVGCHAECEGYREFLEIHEQEIEVIRKNKSENARQEYLSEREFKNRLHGHSKNRVFKQTMR